MAKKKRANPLAFDVVPFGEEDDEQGSVLETAIERGDAELTTQAMVYRAKNLYVTRLKNKRYVAKAVRVKRSTLDRWIYLFGWDEARDQRFAQMQVKLFKKARKALPELGERADRLTDGIEGILEEMVQKHVDGQSPLQPSELKAIVEVLNKTQQMRREMRGEKKTTKIEVAGNLGLVHQLGELAARVTGHKELPSSNQTISVSNIEDAEFELLPDEGSAT